VIAYKIGKSQVLNLVLNQRTYNCLQNETITQVLIFKTLHKMSDFQLQVICGGVVMGNFEATMHQKVANSPPCRCCLCNLFLVVVELVVLV
jgi:hypothetical protein